MKNINKPDKINILLFIFIVLLSSLFYYLYTVNENIKDYNNNHDILARLKLLNKNFNNFSLVLNHFSDYDKINKDILSFKNNFHNLKENLNNRYPNNKNINKKLDHIDTFFKEKRDNLEYFKSLNASIIASSHFLFDLQRTITEDQNISIKTKNLINETLFYLLRYSSSDYIDKGFVFNKINEIKRHNPNKSRVDFILNFHKQALMLFKNFSNLKRTSREIFNSPLSDSISNLHKFLDQKYKKNIYTQTLITILFFIFTIIILILLIITNRNSLKNKKELLAFKYAIQHSDNTIIITDTNRNIVYVNDIFEKTTGYSADEVMGENPGIFKSHKHDSKFYDDMNSKLDKGKKWEGEIINKRKDGSLLYEKVSIVPIFLNTQIINYLAIKLDITKYIERQKQLAQAASVFENTEEIIIITDKNGKATSVNNTFTSIYGYTIQDVKGETLKILKSKKHSQKFYKNMWHEIINNGVWRGKILNKTKDGEIIPIWSTIKQIKDKDGQITSYIAVQTDLRDLEKSQETINYLAYHDSLTGLNNRTSFEKYLSHVLSLARRKKRHIAVLFLDLDRFKVINDTLGHDIGDMVLVEVSKRLKETLRSSDFISRWGGDEFVVILENFSFASELAIVAKNIIKALKKPIVINSNSLVVTVSIGIAIYPENGEDANTLIKHADSAMYLAKDTGKDNFKYYTKELSKEIQDKLNIDLELNNAIENNEIYMVFQPQYNLKTKKVVAVESLVRWENKKLGFIPPDKFIPIAEDSRIIIPLGYFIFEESCKAYKKMKDNGVLLKQIAINVSSIQFKDNKLLQNFMTILKKYDLDASEIEIEITEHFIMENTIANMNLLQNFKNHGFKISIDDFGTGYSSMSYLKQLPINTIKIDKSFVDDISQESNNNIIIDAIIALSKTLKYSIVAEGIEHKEQEEFLKKANCDLGQGYIFSKPIKVDEIINRFSEN